MIVESTGKSASMSWEWDKPAGRGVSAHSTGRRGSWKRRSRGEWKMAACTRQRYDGGVENIGYPRDEIRQDYRSIHFQDMHLLFYPGFVHPVASIFVDLRHLPSFHCSIGLVQLFPHNANHTHNGEHPHGEWNQNSLGDCKRTDLGPWSARHGRGHTLSISNHEHHGNQSELCLPFPAPPHRWQDLFSLKFTVHLYVFYQLL